MWTIFTTQILLGFLAIIICYLVGKLIVRFYDLKGSFFFKLFITYIVGIVSIIFLYSMIKAHGRTVNILLIPFITFFLYYYRKSFKSKPSINWPEIVKDIAWSFGIFTLIFLYQSWFYFDFWKCEIKPLFIDFYAYAYFSKSLQYWGIENYYLTSMNYFFPENRDILVPYHYPELWFTAFWASCFTISSIKSYFLVSYPILILIYLIGICSLFDKLSKLTTITISLLLLFVTSIIFTFPASIAILGQSGAKLAFIYVFLLLSGILILYEKRIPGLLVLIAIPIFSITFLPAIYGACIIMMLLFLFCGGKNNTPILIPFSFIIFTTIALLLLFHTNAIYKTTSVINISLLDNPLFSDLKNEISFQTIKSTTINFIKRLYDTFRANATSLILGLIPFIIITIKFQLRLKYMWLFLICMITCGIITSRILCHVNSNHVQFITNLGAAIVIVIILGISLFINERITQNQYGWWIISSLLIFIIITFSIIPILTDKSVKNVNDYNRNIIDFAFFQKITNSITQQNIVIMTFIIPQYSVFDNLFPTNDEIYFIEQSTNKCVYYVQGNPEIYLNNNNFSKFELDVYNNQIPINVWCQKGKKNTLQSFIQKYKIRYFYFNKGITIPDFISKKAVKVIQSQVTHSIFIITQ